MTTLYPRVTRENVGEIATALAAGLRRVRQEQAEKALLAQSILNGRTPDQVVENFLAQIKKDKQNGETESTLNLGPSELVCGQDVSDWFWNYHMDPEMGEKLSADFIGSLQGEYKYIYDQLSAKGLQIRFDTTNNNRQELIDDEMKLVIRSGIQLVVTH